jgi:hypothetical protein
MRRPAFVHGQWQFGDFEATHEHVFDAAARWFSPTKCLPAAATYSDLQRLDDDRWVFVNQASSQLVLEIR